MQLKVIQTYNVGPLHPQPRKETDLLNVDLESLHLIKICKLEKSTLFIHLAILIITVPVFRTKTKSIKKERVRERESE